MTKIPAKRRAKAATVHTGGKAKFPVDSVHTAHSALKLINNARPPLKPSQRAAVIAQAHTYLPDAAVPPPKGSTKTSKIVPKKKG